MASQAIVLCSLNCSDKLLVDQRGNWPLAFYLLFLLMKYYLEKDKKVSNLAELAIISSSWLINQYGRSLHCWPGIWSYKVDLMHSGSITLAVILMDGKQSFVIYSCLWSDDGFVSHYRLMYIIYCLSIYLHWMHGWVLTTHIDILSQLGTEVS